MLDLFLTADGLLYILIAFIVDETMALVFLGLMLMNALIEKAGDADVKRSGSAGDDVDPEPVMETVAQGEKRSTCSLVRTPRIGIAGDTAVGIFRLALIPLTRDSGSLKMTDSDSVPRTLVTFRFVLC